MRTLGRFNGGMGRLGATATAAPPPAVPSALAGLTDQLFWYTLSPPQLTANQLGVLATVTIDNDSDFEWRWIIASSTGLFSVTLQDNFAAAPLMGGAINGENLAGTAQLPFVLPVPYPLYRTSTLKGSFNDRSGAPNTIQFCLVGYKLNKLPAGPTG